MARALGQAQGGVLPTPCALPAIGTQHLPTYTDIQRGLRAIVEYGMVRVHQLLFFHSAVCAGGLISWVPLP